MARWLGTENLGARWHIRRRLVAAIIALAVLLAARAPAADADPFNSSLTVTYTECPAPACNGNGNIDLGEPVKTTIHTALENDPPVNGGSLYFNATMLFSGVVGTGTVPAGMQVGTGSFSTHVWAGDRCTSASPTITPSYAIYATQDANNTGVYPSLGYGQGLASGESWATFAAAGWIQSFADNNSNNVPDYADKPPPGGSTLAMTARDANANGIPDGAEREPLYLPLADAIVGATHSTRYFGVAVVAGGVAEVPIDFVSWNDFNMPGQSQMWVEFHEDQFGYTGGWPLNPANAVVQTCTPFWSEIAINGVTAAGNVVQVATGTGNWKFMAYTEPDFDGDGLSNAQDNCATVSNPAQADADADQIGDACDTSPAIVTAAEATGDADSDGFPNWNDVCPYAKNIVDTDVDGAPNECDPAPAVPGNGGGWAAGWHDHAFIDQVVGPALPMASGSLGAFAHTDYIDSNSNWVPDLDENTGTLWGSGVLPGDSDGDGRLDSTEWLNGWDPLNPNDNGGGRLVWCAAGPANDCSWAAGAMPTANNMIGDGCNDADEALLPGFGPGPFDQWMFYDVPVPALFSAPNPRYTFRTAGILSAGMAQAIFGYFKRGAKLGTFEYDLDLNRNNVMDGVEYDRTVIAGQTYAGPADGVIGATDAQKAFAQFKLGLRCNSGGYRLGDSTIP